MSRGDFILVSGCIIACFTMGYLGYKHSEQVVVNTELRTIISGQQSVIDGNEATIAAYKDNLTSCLKESKVSTQDEFTGE